MNHCYLCGNNHFHLRSGNVRDDRCLDILECSVCSLVQLSSQDHISDEVYENSEMHEDPTLSIKDWLKETSIDDSKRFKMLSAKMANKVLLDFGCGAGGFLSMSQDITHKSYGVELDIHVRKYWDGKLNIFRDLEPIKPKSIDIITLFHVLEHIKDPILLLKNLSGYLRPHGEIVIEVPCSEDILLTTYDCNKFQDFTYWSKHLYLFNSYTLKKVSEASNLKVNAIKCIQRYPLSNHIQWLINGKPGGHKSLTFLNEPDLMSAYESTLAKIGKTDTILAFLTL